MARSFVPDEFVVPQGLVGPGFTYTVLDDEARVIGCVYIYPSPLDSRVAQVQSWVSANCAELDLPVHDAVANWLATMWPFTEVRYRPTG